MDPKGEEEVAIQFDAATKDPRLVRVATNWQVKMYSQIALVSGESCCRDAEPYFHYNISSFA